MNLEEFLDKRLTREELEGLNANSKFEKIEESKEDNKITITLPSEIVDMVNREANGKKILKNNIVEFMRSLKSDLDIERDNGKTMSEYGVNKLYPYKSRIDKTSYI